MCCKVLPRIVNEHNPHLPHTLHHFPHTLHHLTHTHSTTSHTHTPPPHTHTLHHHTHTLHHLTHTHSTTSHTHTPPHTHTLHHLTHTHSTTTHPHTHTYRTARECGGGCGRSRPASSKAKLCSILGGDRGREPGGGNLCTQHHEGHSRWASNHIRVHVL